MHTENLHCTYTSGLPPGEEGVSGRQKNAFLRNRLFPERQKWIHMPESIILWSASTHTQPGCVVAEKKKGCSSRRSGQTSLFSVKRQQTGRVCRQLCHGWVTCPWWCREDVHNVVGAHSVWPTLSFLTFVQRCIPLRLPRNIQMFWL